jgi:hypothetical protein
LVQFGLPIKENVPGGQSRQVADFMGENVPAGQEIHDDAFTREYVPASQISQTLELAVGAKVPGSQSKHVEAPLFGENVPAGQILQAL